MSATKKSPSRNQSMNPRTIGLLWKCCNQPLLVGLLILAGTYGLQQWGWRDQQHFISQELDQRERATIASSTEEQVVAAAGKRLNACAVVVNAHEQSFDVDQLRPTISEYNTLQEEWDKDED